MQAIAERERREGGRFLDRGVEGATFAALTTLRIGGPIRELVVATTPADVVDAARDADAAGSTLLVLGNGSNVVAGDRGFDGVVLRPATRGTRSDRSEKTRQTVRMTVQAGEQLDPVVERCVDDGLSGIECLAGIPGTVGAAPVHNVGAYGQEIAQTIVAVQAWDRRQGRVVSLDRAAGCYSYRSSRFQRDRRFVILSVTFELWRSPRSRPIRHDELARLLGVGLGREVALADVRAAVLALRRDKGMVLDARDPETRSAGSFFRNPFVGAAALAHVARRARERLGPAVAVPSCPVGHGRSKLPAAWLVEQAGFARGTTRGDAGISAKHALALTARGGSDAAPLIGLAREVRDGVRAAFGCGLHPEPTLVGFCL